MGEEGNIIILLKVYYY